MADTVDSQWGLGTLISLWEDVWFPYLERIPLIPSAILEQWKLNPSLDHFTHILIFIGILVIIIGIVITKCFQKVNQNEIITSKVKAVKNFVAPGEGPRFRKRDRIEFIARKAVKNAKAVGSYIRGGQGRKRRDMAKLVKKVFMKNAPDSQSQMVRPGLPEMFLEEEGAFEAEGGRLPEAFILVMKNLRVFGHFDECILIELMKNIKYVTLRPNDYLFKIGDADENMYIVETGELKVYYDQVSHDGELKSIELKKVKPGEPIVSLLSFLDYLAGNRKLYKTVSCRAGKAKDTKVIKFNFSAFKSAFDLYPEHLLKVVQVVMVRLQRVTLLALLQYLGLSAELINTQNRGASSAPPVLRKQYSAEDAAVNQESGGLPIPGSSNAGGNNSQLVASPQTSSSNDESFISNAFRSKKKIEKLSDEQLSGLAAESFKNLLGLTDEDFVDNDDADLITDIDLESYKEGDKIVEEDSMSRSCLFLVLQGSVVVSQGRVGGSAKDMHKANPGGLLGQLQVLTNEPSFFTYRAKTDCRLAVLSAENVRKCMKAHPYIGIRLAMHVIDNLSPYVRSIDFALEWMQVESGKAIYHQGDLADCTYVILSGRLRSVIKVGKGSGAKKELVKEYGRGELTGIVETLLQTPRSTTVIAVRDTEVAKLPAGLIDVIKLKFPSVMDRLMKLLCGFIQQSWVKGSHPRSMVIQDSTVMPSGSSVQHGSAQSNFSTVAIISTNSNIPTTSFTLELLHALNGLSSLKEDELGPALRLTKEVVLKELGPTAFDKAADFRLASWLTQQEDKNAVVLYQCDPDMTRWTQLSIRHADVIFILADQAASGTNPSRVTKLEDAIETYAPRTRKEMIFLHKEDVKYPKGTADWLRARNWINAHYHIKCPPRMYFKKTPDRVIAMYKRILEQGGPPDIHSDFSRLSRMITGYSYGLVLGGGGARGCSHVGMIKAILEAGIPIDQVAGVSIGSFIGGIWCQEKDVTNMIVKARSFCLKMSQIWRHISSITYPYSAWMNGHSFNILLEEVFEDRDILDLWIPYFTITTDITNSALRVHDYGSLWRYVRSSMSLAGYIPPLCDPHDGHLLLDGGYVNNLPADIMRRRGANYTLAVDVGAQDDVNFTNYGDMLSGWKVLWHKWNPFLSPITVPNQADIQSRLAYVSCVDKLESVKNSTDNCEYIRPPIDRYGTLQFGAFDEIKDVGYYHGKTLFSGLMKARGIQRQNSSERPQIYNCMRRNSMENLSSILSSSLDSQHSGEGGPVAPSRQAMILEGSSGVVGPRGRDLANLADMVCSVRKPFADATSEVGSGLTSHSYPSTKAPGSDETASSLRRRQQQHHSHRDEAGSERVEDYDDDELTDEDSDNLLSDEEDDDGESGFLSQM